MSIPLGVLTNKITHKVQWSKLTYLQPILTFVHSNLCPSTPTARVRETRNINQTRISCLVESVPYTVRERSPAPGLSRTLLLFVWLSLASWCWATEMLSNWTPIIPLAGNVIWMRLLLLIIAYYSLLWLTMANYGILWLIIACTPSHSCSK